MSSCKAQNALFLKTVTNKNTIVQKVYLADEGACGQTEGNAYEKTDGAILSQTQIFRDMFGWGESKIKSGLIITCVESESS